MFVSGKFHFIVWRLIFTSEHFRFSNLTYQFCLRRTENEIEIYQLLKTWFNPNCPWFCKAIIFCVARKSKILHTTRHGLTLEIETKTVFFSKETYILLEPIQSMKNKVSNIGPNEPICQGILQCSCTSIHCRVERCRSAWSINCTELNNYSRVAYPSSSTIHSHYRHYNTVKPICD
jgi:hypothetical protein